MSIKKRIEETEDVLKHFNSLPLEVKQLNNKNEILILENQLEILKVLQEISDNQPTKFSFECGPP